MISRTSWAHRQATANLAAHASASWREGTSMIEIPPMTALVSGYGPAVMVPSGAAMLARWLSSPPPKIHTPASLAAYTTWCEASATTGKSSSGKIIVPSSNEIRYRVNSWLLVPARLRGRLVHQRQVGATKAPSSSVTSLGHGVQRCGSMTQTSEPPKVHYRFQPSQCWEMVRKKPGARIVNLAPGGVVTTLPCS